MQANAINSAEPEATEPEATEPGESDKAQRQALYLAYRAIGVDTAGNRMTQAAACKLVGVDTTTVSRWKRDDEQFRAKEREAIQYGIGQARKLAKAGVWALLGTAIYQLAALLRAGDTPPSVKAQLVLKLLKYAGAGEPVEIEISGDPWGAVLQRLAGAKDDEAEEGRTGGREEGRTGGVEEGRTGGREDRRKGGQKEGRTGGREDRRKGGRDDGRSGGRRRSD